MVDQYLVTEAEAFSVQWDDATGELFWTRQNGEQVRVPITSGLFASKATETTVESGRLSEGELSATYAQLAALYARVRTGRIARLGDSNTANGTTPYDVGSGLIVTLADGWWHWLQAFSGQSLSLVYDGGVGGDTTAMMLARLTDIVASGAEICTVMGGTNDIYAGRTFEQITADLTTIYSTLTAEGIMVAAMQILPTTDWDAGQRAKQQQVNGWIADYAAVHPGIIPVDFAADVTDGSGVAIAELFRPDGRHLKAGAAIRIGRRVWDAIAPYMIGSSPVIQSNGDPANALTNGLMLGDASGVATGWAVSTPDAAVYTASKVARSDGKPGEWQRIALTSGTIYLDCVIPQAGSVAWTSTTQSLTGEMEVVGDATTLTQFDIAVYAENSSGGVHKRAYGYFDSYTSAKRGPIPSALLRAYPLAGYNVAATHARLRITMKGAGTLDFSRAALRPGLSFVL